MRVLGVDILVSNMGPFMYCTMHKSTADVFLMLEKERVNQYHSGRKPFEFYFSYSNVPYISVWGGINYPVGWVQIFLSADINVQN